MSKSFIEEFKKEFSFLEEYGFVFSIDPCNPNRPCYKNNYGEIIYWIDSNSGIGWNTEIYYQISGWKYSIDIEEEYRKIFRKNTFLKDKIKIFKELFEFLVNSTGMFYELKIDKNISNNLKFEEVTDLNVFRNNEKLFNQRNKAITNICGVLSLIILFFVETLGFLCFYEWSKSYEIMNVVNISILGSIMISELLIFILLRKNLHIISKLSLIIYAFIPLTLYFFFERRIDYKIEIVFLCLMLISMIIHLLMYFIKKNTFYLVNGIIPVIYPLFVNIAKTFILNEYLFFNDDKLAMFIVAGLIIGLIIGGFVLLLSKKRETFKESIGLAIGIFTCTFVVVAFVPYFTIQNINYSFDNSIPNVDDYVVLDKEIIRGHGRYTSTNYYLIIEINGNQEQLNVNKRIYFDYDVNDKIELIKYDGFFENPYYEYVED